MPKLILGILFIAFPIYVYGAWKFNNKVRIFNTRIEIGDSFDDVDVQLGRPSIIIAEYPRPIETGIGRVLETNRTILWVYSGAIFLRSDLSLIFDYDTGKLIDKSRITHLIE
ncbi:MAG: hypothetical protein KA243_04330 [Candidatus Aminicenantes bacterium]|nr:hypothetical protein [Candidatus Aminicenantes bacterium]NLH77786.1 hypothetical protein [Acidobacteriota bacterium]